MSDFKYIGSELELFAAARNWKSYWSNHLRPFVSGDVLEVGAGIGANTLFLDRAVDRGQWVCLEPDPRLGAELIRNLQDAQDAKKYEFVCGTIQNLEAWRHFDTIVYIDVLEHIESDGDELLAAASHLRRAGVSLSFRRHISCSSRLSIPRLVIIGDITGPCCGNVPRRRCNWST